MPPTDWTAEIRTAAQRAQAQGAMVRLVSETHAVQQEGLDFLVSHLSSLSLKDLAKILQQNTGANPFLPYEPAMFVADLSDTHVLLLNKFPIFPDHAMAVTRRFMLQTGELEPSDFDAVACSVLGTGDAVFMFNGGKRAGASQPHRHVHILPSHQLPLMRHFPVDAAPGTLQQLPFFGFVHAYLPLDARLPVAEWAQQLQHAVQTGFAHCGLAPHLGELPPYNLLGSRQGVLLVPRRCEHWSDGTHSLSIHALNFGGWVGVKGPEQIEPACQAGLMNLLNAVTQPRD
ncbi:hypothetical protein [Ideonella oryzae]|uniref:Phosphorylase n=1 Tax=Ideonella oryzae TaxID=2937441 RepID=A0ABT1BJ04_9BURK|nr:hypothetical protein [Ideonella oryzae]MCO5975596.1 hypothetical protein [Ideonella oryzae]